MALVTEIAEQPMKPDEALALVGLETRMDHFPPSFPAASSSGSPSRELSRSGRKSCSATSRPARWTPRQVSA